MALTVRRYDSDDAAAWNAFVIASKNGTFLFHRDYMEYHRDRFHDCSLLVFDNSTLIALFPANRADHEVHSHQGLTYGGLVTADSMTTPLMLDAFAALSQFLRDQGVRRLFYKTMPSIYHCVPAEEDRYALFLANAVLYRRDVLSVIPRGSALDRQSRRLRGAKKAEKSGVVVGASDDWTSYWTVLLRTLESRFGIAPVHSLEEIRLLRSRFPENIRLHIARIGEEMVAGVVIYASDRVAHTQYVATSERGRETGALDRLFLHLIEEVYPEKAYFDFGISNESDGRILNRGLIEQKEGFGARAVVHDFYRLDI